MENPKSYQVRCPLFPPYSKPKALLGVWDGVAKSDVLSMIKAITDQTGTPQNPVDWSEPDSWISERLTGKEQELAVEIWEAGVNPRHVYGSYLFINLYGLLECGPMDVLHLTENGKGFIMDEPGVVAEIDQSEGIPQLLEMLKTRSSAKRGDLVEEWGEFLHAHSKFGKESTIRDTLRRRLVNVVEGGYVHRDGNTYQITPSGSAYAETVIPPKEQQPQQELSATIRAYNKEQQELLRKTLGSMNPYRFEALVKDLLEAMDYTDVEVTKQSGDKGIDVVASYEFGITQITEVVQVKRQQGSITRPILDQLRGALPYHQAIRGTIITIGKFAKGCKEAALFPGAPPITLIDGEKLIELLIKHGVGVKRRNVALVEVDEGYFADHEAAVTNGAEPGDEIIAAVS